MKNPPFSRLSICSLVNDVRLRCSFLLSRSRICGSSSPDELCMSELPSEILPSLQSAKFIVEKNIKKKQTFDFRSIAFICCPIQSRLCPLLNHEIDEGINKKGKDWQIAADIFTARCPRLWAHRVSRETHIGLNGNSIKTDGNHQSNNAEYRGDGRRGKWDYDLILFVFFCISVCLHWICGVFLFFFSSFYVCVCCVRVC